MPLGETEAYAVGGHLVEVVPLGPGLEPGVEDHGLAERPVSA